MNNYETLTRFAVKEGRFAPEFDPDFYKSVQPDLAQFDQAALLEHYERYGRTEGRIATPAAHRIGFVAQIPTTELVLEIGPAVRPTLTGDHVRYFDIQDSKGLIERAKAEGYPADRCPTIHYVSSTGDLTVIPDKFQNVFSSHCIEHQPDLIAHLMNVSALLMEGGRYFMIIPDKRYCFDALLPPSQLDQLLEAHREKRKFHTMKSIFEHYVLTTHNEAEAHWRGQSDDPRLDQRAERAAIAVDRYDKAKGGYVDVHAWQFTPSSFRQIINNLSGNELDLKAERVYDTIYGKHEFCAILRKT